MNPVLPGAASLVEPGSTLRGGGVTSSAACTCARVVGGLSYRLLPPGYHPQSTEKVPRGKLQEMFDLKKEASAAISVYIS